MVSAVKPIWVSVSVSDQNQNSGFGRTLMAVDRCDCNKALDLWLIKDCEVVYIICERVEKAKRILAASTQGKETCHVTGAKFEYSSLIGQGSNYRSLMLVTSHVRLAFYTLEKISIGC